MSFAHGWHKVGASEGDKLGDELGALDGDELGVADGASDGDELGASEGDKLGDELGAAIHPRSSSCSEGRNQRRIKTKQGGIKQGAGYGRRARLTLSYKQARVRLCGRSAGGQCSPCQRS